MTLHPHITRAELDAYTHLAWEHRVRRVKVDAKTLQTIHNLLKTDTHYGVKYTTAP